MDLWWDLGIGTNYTDVANVWTTKSGCVGANSCVDWISTDAATFYITGVQLEVGSFATTFDRRPFAIELELCQRYYEKSYNVGTLTGSSTLVGTTLGIAVGTTYVAGVSNAFKVVKRTTPTVTLFGQTGTAAVWTASGGGNTAAATVDQPSERGFIGVNSSRFN